MHGGFEVPAPEIDELAAQLERVKAERAESQPDPPPEVHPHGPRAAAMGGALISSQAATIGANRYLHRQPPNRGN